MILNRSKLRSPKLASSLINQDINRIYRRHILGGLPTTLNLLVNDVCNSKCQMCLIWKNKPDREFLPVELESILSDSLFKRLEYVGVSGGEPTLRKDLVKIFEILCQKTPKLKGLGIITNGILHDVVKDRILSCSRICEEHAIPFNVMVSIDGVGAVHDVVRGRPGNFESSIKLLEFFAQETHIPTSFGCTITKENVFQVDELLDYAKEKNIYGRFRIAEFIERLYNTQQTDYIRAFDDLEAYHLGLLFHRLEKDFEVSKTHQKTYSNIRKMVAEGKPRSIGCPYQSESVVITSRGDLLYCSPKSPILGNTLTSSASSIYYSNLKIRDKIKAEDCQTCIHDYHEPLTFWQYLSGQLNTKKQSRKYNIKRLLIHSKGLSSAIKNSSDLDKVVSRNRVLIVGWYGTETVGDKAILWSIINNLRSRSNAPELIEVSSLFPFVTKWTLRELEIHDISVVETYTDEFEDSVSLADEIIMGGGPLMDLKVLDHVLYAFSHASSTNVKKSIYGCGIGPLARDEYIETVSEIIRLSNSVTLRDSASVKFCIEQLKGKNIACSEDPATDFIEFYKNGQNHSKRRYFPFPDKEYLACFLREWGKDYSYDLNESDYNDQKHSFEKNLTEMIAHISLSQSLYVNLLPMHSFHVGGDDRIFNRKISKEVKKAIERVGSCQLPGSIIDCASVPVSPTDILENMSHAKICLCMRFHSVLFAENLDIPYIAIDYTRGGKIEAFLRGKGKINRMLTIEDISSGQWRKKIVSILESLKVF
ncbi:MAG: radical SAM protein [Leptolyngbya sp.]|nr:MAG: radical SAM protein [Leptolyngbya sp.]